MHNCQCQNVSIYPLYISLTKGIKFSLRVLTHFSLEVSEQFGIENQKRKTRNIEKYFLNYINPSNIVFYA